MATPRPLRPLQSVSAPPPRHGGESSAQEEFFAAVERYRRTQGRPFPTWSEVLEIAASLGYRKVSPAGPDSPIAAEEQPGRRDGCRSDDAARRGV